MIIQEEHWVALIGKYLSGNTSDEERESLVQWLELSDENRSLFDHLEQIWSEANTPTIQTSTFEKDRYWQNISTAIEAQPEVIAKPRSLWPRIAAAAAVVLLLVFAWQLTQTPRTSSPQMVEVQATEQVRQVDLPDGSQVWLREGSQLTFEEGLEQRDVTLEGEGYFEIAHDPGRPFQVHVGHANALVLGTKFNLRQSGNGDVELFVAEGRVAFSTTTGSDQGIVLERNQVALSPLDRVIPQLDEGRQGLENVLSWQTNRLVFDHARLGQILNDLERHYGVQFTVADDGILNCEMKADFESVTLEEVIKTLEFSLNCRITSNNGLYQVTGEPCNIPTK